MRAKVGWGLVWGAVLIGFWMLPSRRAAAGNCALYARAQTGVDLYGAAGGWWDEAATQYWRGHVPQVGSILVFKRTGYIPSGHVAVVAQIIGAREIIVNQANWYRGRVTPYVPVVDESPNNDWTEVSVMDLGTGKYGRDNPSFGFVYPQTGPREIVASTETDTVGFHAGLAAGRAAFQPGQPDELFRFAGVAAADERRRNVRHKTAARGSRRKRAAAHAPHLAAAMHARRRAEGHAHSFAHVHPAAYAHHEPVHAALAQPRSDAAPSRRAEQKPRHRA